MKRLLIALIASIILLVPTGADAQLGVEPPLQPLRVGEMQVPSGYASAPLLRLQLTTIRLSPVYSITTGRVGRQRISLTTITLSRTISITTGEVRPLKRFVILPKLPTLPQLHPLRRRR